MGADGSGRGCVGGASAPRDLPLSPPISTIFTTSTPLESGGDWRSCHGGCVGRASAPRDLPLYSPHLDHLAHLDHLHPLWKVVEMGAPATPGSLPARPLNTVFPPLIPLSPFPCPSSLHMYNGNAPAQIRARNRVFSQIFPPPPRHARKLWMRKDFGQFRRNHTGGWRLPSSWWAGTGACPYVRT